MAYLFVYGGYSYRPEVLGGDNEKAAPETTLLSNAGLFSLALLACTLGPGPGNESNLWAFAVEPL